MSEWRHSHRACQKFPSLDLNSPKHTATQRTPHNVQLLRSASPGVLHDCSFKRTYLILYITQGAKEHRSQQRGTPGKQDAERLWRRRGKKVIYCFQTTVGLGLLHDCTNRTQRRFVHGTVKQSWCCCLNSVFVELTVFIIKRS